MLRHRRLLDAERHGPQQDRRISSRQSYHQVRRSHEDEDEEEVDTDNEQRLEDRWRQAAQMLTDDDEIQLFAGSESRRPRQQQHHQVNSKQRSGKRSAAHFAGGRPDSSSPNRAAGASTTTEHDDEEEEEDDNSSISFAQSGCHSILSAWRIKAANRASRQQSRRPTSVLSNASSAGKKSAASTQYTSRGKSPAAQTRIPLGPKAAQHYVTNTRRRRQANELILSTLEARRRVLALNRQNAASLFGSASYLADPLFGERPNSRTENEPLLQAAAAAAAASDDYSPGGMRLSLSPSPAMGGGGGGKSPSPQPLHVISPARNPRALSDLGAGRTPNASAAAQAQRQRLLLSSANARAKHEPQTGTSGARPPLARLDQNSSDLCSTNSYSDTASSSASSGSQFTQLVTGELAPDCILLDEQALRPRLQQAVAGGQAQGAGGRQSPLKPVPPPKHLRPNLGAPPKHLRPNLGAPPKVPERPAKQSSRSPAQVTSPQRTIKPQEEFEYDDDEEDEDEEDKPVGRLRRSLRRDSIRRLRMRMSRSASVRAKSSSSDSTDANPNSSSDSSRGNSEQHQPKSRKLEHSPPNPTDPAHLNRNNFRTTSMRSESSQRQAKGATTRDEQEAPAARGEISAKSKRSSWLFGLASSPRKAATTEQASPRVFSEARRASSSEHISSTARSSSTSAANKKSKHQQQEAQEQDEEIKRVERMLRNMRPNQVFTSYARESSESRNMVSSTNTNPQPVARQQQSIGNSSSSRSTTINPIQATVPNAAQARRPTSPPARAAPPQHQQQTMGHSLRPTQAEATKPRPPARSVSPQTASRFVRESSKSQDDLKFDLAGNRRKHQLQERWRQERLEAPERRIETLTSQRIERSRTTNLSPPIGFEDDEPTVQVSSRSEKPSTTTVGAARRALSESRPPVAPPRARPVESPPPLARKPAVPQRSTLSMQHSLEHQRAPVQPAQRQVPLQVLPRTLPKPKAQNLRQDSGTEPAKSQPARIQASLSGAPLPKFERTADDEFRKRVDYLRKLARSNLLSSSTNETPASSVLGGSVLVDQKRPAPTTKPMSTYWRQAASQDATTSDERKSSVSPLGPIEARTRWNYSPERSSARPGKPAATNLDALLVSAGYQPPTGRDSPGFKWRRSNSSLASLTQYGAGKSQQAPQQTALSTASTGNGERVQQEQLRNPQAEPQKQQLTSSALVKLVVKEKSAPKLDYAFVEKQQQQQPIDQVQPIRRAERPTQLQSPVKGSSPGLRGGQQLGSTTLANNKQASLEGARGPLRVASPRSPDFGNMAASSNDDSAIASSVSSPSLSFMMNLAGGQDRAGQSGQEAASRSNQQLLGIRPPPNQPPPRTANETAGPGALQSILRRQQHHQQLLQLSESPEMESQMMSGTGAAMEPPVSGGGGGGHTKRPQSSAQPREPLFRSDARSPEPSARVGSPLQTGGPLVTTATVTSTTQQQQQGSGQLAGGGSSSSPPKRVHFNDRASIRSFESISSLSSNSTAVPNELLRQQVGSPDSMGSGSTSRLSAESPDFRKGSGAAIYAVRGDPELELDHQPQAAADHLAGPPQTLHGQQHQVSLHQQPYLIQQQQAQFVPQYPSPASSMMIQQQQQQPRPFIRMTAPPRITTGAPASPQSGNPIQYLARPTPIPQLAAKPAVPYKQQQQQLDDDDDPDYALRLRQAATSRVFSYAPSVQQQQQAIHQAPMRHPQMRMAPPSQQATPSGGQLQPRQAPGVGVAGQQQPGGGRRTLGELMNFQTEV